MKKHIIETKKLTKQFGKKCSVNEVDLEVYEGEIYGFLGHNGAGKTTTIGMLLGLLHPTSGEAYVLGEKITPSRNKQLKNVGSLIGAPGFVPGYSGLKNLQLVALEGKGINRNKIDQILEKVGLTQEQAKRKVSGYSTGMKQRLGLAIALIHDPKLIILDEPTSGLDPNGIREFRELLRTLCDQDGTSIFFSSHQMSEVELICDRVGIMNQGILVKQGAIKELVSSNRQLIVEVDKAVHEKALGLLSCNNYPYTVLPTGELAIQQIDMPQLLQYFVAEHNIFPVNMYFSNETSLENIFRQVTTREVV